MSTDISRGRSLRIFQVGQWVAPMVVAIVLLLAGCQPIQPEAAAVPATQANDVLVDEVISTSGSSQVEALPPNTPEAVVTPTVEVAVPEDPALVAAGLDVYRKAYCGVCHELAAAGTTGTFGPPHNGIGTVAAERVADPNYGGEAKTAAEYLHESLLEPEAYFTPGYGASMHRMPAFSHLSQADLDALVAFLLAQK